MAVDEATGTVYVVDEGNNRVESFNSTGNYIGQFDASGTREVEGEAAPTGQLSAPSGIAIVNDPLSPALGDVYVVDTGHNVIDKFDASGRYLGQLTGTGPSSAIVPFPPIVEGSHGLRGVASDANGHLWVYDSSEGKGIVDEYSTGLSDEYVRQWPTERETSRGIAVDSQENIYVPKFTKNVEKFSSAGVDLGTVDECECGSGLASNAATDALYVDQGSAMAEFGAFGEPFKEPLQQFGTLVGGEGVAVNGPTGSVYVADTAASDITFFTLAQLPVVRTEAASAVTAFTAVLAGTVTAGEAPPTSCEFEYATDADYGVNASYDLTVPCGVLPGASEEAVPVEAQVSQLQPGTTYHYRLVVANANGVKYGGDQQLETLPPPTVEAAAATNVGSASADLTARINPNEQQTSYRFEYGESVSYGQAVPVPDADIGSGASPQPVSEQIVGLKPETTYHFRVRAVNAAGVTTDGDHTFVYAPAGSLPDHRAYEMVTPPYKSGAFIQTYAGAIASNGSSVVGVTYAGFAGTESNEFNGGSGAFYSFTRTGNGWTTTPLSPSAQQLLHPRGQLVGATVGIWSSSTAVSGNTNGEDDLFLRAADGTVRDIGAVWPPSLGAQETGIGQYAVLGASEDGSHVVFEILRPQFAWPFDPSAVITENAPSLYEYLPAAAPGSQPHLIGVLGGAGSPTLAGECGIVPGAGQAPQGTVSNAISRSGDVVVFTALAGTTLQPPEYLHTTCTGAEAKTGIGPPTDELYARVGGAETVWISQPRCTRSSPGCHNVGTDRYTSTEQSQAADVVYEGASADGSKVFFTTTQQLLNSDTDTTRDLYEYDFARPPGQRLIQVSAGGNGDATPGAHAQVQGVSRISEDGSHAYFVAQGVLTTDPNANGDTAQPGAENLYAYAAGTTHFVAELCSGSKISGVIADSSCPARLNSDRPTREGLNDRGLWSLDSGELWDREPITVTPDGQFAVFTSFARLTADDHSNARQAFEYDAATGSLVRVSKGQQGFNDNGNSGLADAKIVTQLGRENPMHNAGIRTMSDDGAYVLFQSAQALTPGALSEARIDQAGDRAQNVYEFHQGDISLISDGKDATFEANNAQTGNSAVELLGTSASGRDVFFTTGDQLVAQDSDTQIDVYDARIEGGFPPPASPSSCTGDRCQGLASAPPESPLPASSLYTGAGNLVAPTPHPGGSHTSQLARALKACKSRPKRKRRACALRARKRYGKSGSARRTSRSTKRDRRTK